MQQTSRAVIWDSIIREEKDALIKQSVDNEYTINDQSGRLRGRDVRLTLHYDVMPIVGLLRIGRLTRTGGRAMRGLPLRVWLQIRRGNSADALGAPFTHSALCSLF